MSSQKKLLQKYAKEHGFGNTRYYVDDGYTGTNFNRPGFQKLLEMEIITPAILRELIDRIEVYETQGTGKDKIQRIAIYYRFVGYLELPEGILNPNYTADLRRGVAVEYIPKIPA